MSDSEISILDQGPNPGPEQSTTLPARQPLRDPLGFGKPPALVGALETASGCSRGRHRLRGAQNSRARARPAVNAPFAQRRRPRRDTQGS